MEKFDWTYLIRPNIRSLTPYRCARDDYNTGILLDANENSFGPPFSPEFLAQKQWTQLSLERYPDPYQKSLKELIASFRCVNSNQIFLGVGSDEAIDLLIRITCEPKMDNILITPPTYGMYEVCAHINQVDILRASLISETFQINVETILKTITCHTKLIFLCSPGNPTSRLLQWKDIEKIFHASQFNGFVVVDEAYIDFAPPQSSCCQYLNQYPRLIILQTCSKGFGLAGIRLGMAFGHPEVIQFLNNVKAPYNINQLTFQAGMEAFQNLNIFHQHLENILKERSKLIQSLNSFPSIHKVYPSDSNFILFQMDHAYEIYKEMADSGIVIRYRGNLPLLKDCLRVTVGTCEQNQQLIQKLQNLEQKYSTSKNSY